MSGQLSQQDYETVPVGRIQPHPDNARRGNLPLIRESIRTNGFVGACVVQRSTGNILVEGDTFTGRSSRLSWSESKDLIVFEGDGRSDAARAPRGGHGATIGRAARCPTGATISRSPPS